jgi:hypothetical protein
MVLAVLGCDGRGRPTVSPEQPTGTVQNALHGCRAFSAQPPTALYVDISSIWSDGSNIYVTAGPNLFRFDGKVWSRVPIDCSCGTLTGVFGSGPNDIHVSAASGGTSFHFDGTSWTADPLSDMSAVWSSDPTCVVMVGPAPAQVEHFEGVSWTRDPLPEIAAGRDFFAVWGSGDKNILAVGAGGTILRHAVRARGWGEPVGDWAPEASGTDVALSAVWGTGATDTFAAGGAGTILHYDGSSWRPMESGTSSDLFGLSGSASDDVFAVGSGGTVLHFDGTNWTALPNLSTADLKGVVSVARGSAIAGGAGGLLECGL